MVRLAQLLKVTRDRLERGPDVAAKFLDALGRRRVLLEPVPGEPARPERDGRRQFGEFVLPVGHFEGAAADVQVQDGAGAPPVPAADGEECHRGLFAARQFLERHGGFMLDPGQHGRTVGGLADGGGTEGQQVLGFVLGREFPRLKDELDQLVLAGVIDAAVALEELNEGQRAFVRGERHGARAGMGVHEQEVDGV